MTCVPRHLWPPSAFPALLTQSGRRDTPRGARGAMAFTERQARDAETAEGSSSDIVKQKSSCEAETLPREQHDGQMEKTSRPPAPSTPCPCPRMAPASVCRPARCSLTQPGEARPQPSAAGKSSASLAFLPDSSQRSARSSCQNSSRVSKQAG